VASYIISFTNSTTHPHITYQLIVVNSGVTRIFNQEWHGMRVHEKKAEITEILYINIIINWKTELTRYTAKYVDKCVVHWCSLPVYHCPLEIHVA